MKHAFCFPGGGFKSAVQAGFVKNIVMKRRIYPSLVVGTSGGALVGALTAMGKYDLLLDLYKVVGSTEGSAIFKPYLVGISGGKMKPVTENIRNILTDGITFRDKISLVTKSGQQNFIKKVIENGKSVNQLLDNSPLEELLKTHVRKADFKCDFYMTLVSLYDGSLYTVRHDGFATDDDLAMAILASSSMPGICDAVETITLADGRVIRDASDGGIRASSPIPYVYQNIDRSDDWTVWSMNSNSIKQMVNGAKKNIVVQAAASIDIMLNNGLDKDVSMTKKINEWALADPEWALRNNIIYAKLNNIEVPLGPDGDSLLGSTLDARKEWIDKRISIGYDLVDSYFTDEI